MLGTDWRAVQGVYQQGITTGDATFETEAPSWSAWDADHLKEPRLVAVEAETVTGWAALCAVSSRCVYAGVAEVSLYVARAVQGRGTGRALLQALIIASERHGLWTLQAGIFPENTSSLKVHEQCGFRLVGYRERLGRMNGKWRDVLLLERRSSTVGAQGS